MRLQRKQFPQKGAFSIKETREFLAPIYLLIKDKLGDAKLTRKLLKSAYSPGITRHSLRMIDASIKVPNGMFILLGTEKFLILEFWGESKQRIRITDIDL